MSLTKGLLNILDNSNEPISKRLKIVENAFNSAELPIQNREAILLKWIVKNTSNNDREVWNTFNKLISTEQVKNLRRCDINQDDITFIIQQITNALQELKTLEENDKQIIFNAINSLLENRTFQQYFKFNVDKYCLFISNVLANTNDKMLFLNLIKRENVFSKQIISQDNFSKTFMDTCLSQLIELVNKYEGDEELFQEVCNVVQKCVFHKTYKPLEEHIKRFFEENENKEKYALLKIIFKHLTVFYKNNNTNISKDAYKLMFASYCNYYNNNFSMVYKFFILLLEHLGFDVTDSFKLRNASKIQFSNSLLSKSLEILETLLHVLTKNKITLDCSVNKNTFSNFLQNIVLSVINLSEKSNKTSIKIIDHCIEINPLVAEPLINEILVFLMLSDNSAFKSNYENLIISIFEVFSKLHRIQNLISKMLPSIKAGLSGTFASTNSSYEFRGVNDLEKEAEKRIDVTEMLPDSLLSCFSKCITNLASWQVMNLFKTFIYHLDAAAKDINDVVDSEDYTYMEIISRLVCCFLSSVRTAEHTVTTSVVEKFIKGMEELKAILGKLGTFLISKKHNQTLMQSFLKICYTWGEVYIMVTYYCNDQNINFVRTLDNDYASCNITYLHNYLKKEQWFMISQRITNFGEKPCKIIMQQLRIQKIRAAMLFEENCNDEMQNAVVNDVAHEIQEHWNEIVYEPFVLNNVISKMDGVSIIELAEAFLKDVQNAKDYTKLKNPYLSDCEKLTNGFLYVALKMIVKLFKQKRKHGNENIIQPCIVQAFSQINEETFFNGDDITDIIEGILNITNQEETFNSVLQINETKLGDYLKIISNIPVIYTNKEVQTVVLLFLFALLIDINVNNIQSAKDACEQLIIGIIQNDCTLILNNFPFNTIVEKVTNNFSKYEELFSYISNCVVKTEDFVIKFAPAIKYIQKHLKRDEKTLRCGIIFLKTINKFKKYKTQMEIKNKLSDYRSGICSSISRFLKNSDTSDKLEPFALILRNYLQKNDKEEINLMTPLLENYIESAIKKATANEEENTQGALLLFLTVLHHKSQLKIEENFSIKVWNAIKNMNVPEQDEEDFAQLIVLIYEHVSNEEFSSAVKDLLDFAMNDKESNNYQDFRKHLKTWKSILSCNLNIVKTKTWQDSLETLLKQSVNAVTEEEMLDVFEDIANFEIAIIQSNKLPLTATLFDLCMYTSCLLKTDQNFTQNFVLCITILDSLLKHRKALVMDRLPSFLQQYRNLLKLLCTQSNSDVSNESTDFKALADCAHRLEKLTKALVANSRDMGRISMYVIADVLQQYEQITLHPNVKLHLNNCLYSLISLCDQHAVSYLMRVLSAASTEMFKMLYENYKKYYRFTGKV